MRFGKIFRPFQFHEKLREHSRSRRFFFLSWTVLLVCCGGLVGCASFWPWHKSSKSKSAKTPQAKPVEFFGEIKLVNSEGRFVLIDQRGALPVLPGTRLRARSGDTISAELRVTEVRHRPFIIADCVSGMPSVGDRVFAAVAIPVSSEKIPPSEPIVRPSPRNVQHLPGDFGAPSPAPVPGFGVPSVPADF